MNLKEKLRFVDFRTTLKAGSEKRTLKKKKNASLTDRWRFLKDCLLGAHQCKPEGETRICTPGIGLEKVEAKDDSQGGRNQGTIFYFHC